MATRLSRRATSLHQLSSSQSKLGSQGEARGTVVQHPWAPNGGNRQLIDTVVGIGRKYWLALPPSWGVVQFGLCDGAYMVASFQRGPSESFLSASTPSGGHPVWSPGWVLTNSDQQYVADALLA